MTATVGALCWGVALLLQPPMVKEAPPDSASAQTDSATIVEGPTLHDIAVAHPFTYADSLRRWPPGMEETIAPSPLVFQARERGLGTTVSGELSPMTPGLVWHGLPLAWHQETGGDLTTVSGAACATVLMSRLPPWLGNGLGTIRVAPWESVTVAPLSSVHVLRGDHNDRSYAVALSTGVSSRVFSLVSISLSKGDGARTNADYSRTQYDVRLDLRPPVLSACRVTAQRGRVQRGDPGPDPRLWPSADDPLSPGYWAIGQGHGAADAMWAHDRESLTKDVLAVQFDHVMRGRRLGAAVVEESVDARLVRSVPTVAETPTLRTASGEISARRRAVLARIPLAEAEEESLWAGLAVERVARVIDVGWSTGDSAWSERDEEEVSTARAGLGLGVPNVNASIGVISSRGTSRLSWGLVATRDFPGFRLEAGGSEGSWQRGAIDLWQARLAADDPPRERGRVGTGWLSVGRESLVGDVTVGGVVGWGSEVWGWCESESLPPGVVRRWGPASLAASGVNASWRASLLDGITAEAWIRAMPWEMGAHPVPGWPRTAGSLRVAVRHALGRAATPSADITARYVGRRHAGAAGALPLDGYWQIDAHGALEIGDFTVRVVAENLTTTRHQDQRGYPVEGLQFRAGFSWLFRD